MKNPREVLTSILVWLGWIRDPNLRPIEVVEINCGDSLFQTTTVWMIPPNVEGLKTQAMQYGYKGEEDYDSIISFLFMQSIVIVLEGMTWKCINSKILQAPKELFDYAYMHGYSGNGCLQSVGRHLANMGMTPRHHPDGHWSIESTPHLG